MQAEIVDNFPHKIREVEHELIPLADGTRLAVRYWLPVDAESNPVPAILEYMPYCKRDGTAARDEAIHPYFAGHGYAAIRVDIRGSGESEGVLLDEYLKLEQDDALEIIAWIAEQPWCNGKVGMMGKSWGGFNGLQVAARRPEALKCIVTVFFTDDRYADDVHYIGGCMALENPAWSFAMFPAMARPPDPALMHENWRELWQQRLEANRPWVVDWTRHQRRDAYWKHGSVCEDYSQINIPVYAIGGWADPYSNPVPRLLAGLEVPCKGLIGPWGHYYMQDVFPGPRIGFMDEAMRWWDYWLKDIDTGIMDEPKLRIWVEDAIRPNAFHQYRPGYWAGEEDWPSQNITDRTYYLAEQTLVDSADAGVDSAGPDCKLSINPSQITGQCMPFFGSMGIGEPHDPLDQRKDDALSLCFDGPALEQEMTLMGAPLVNLEVVSDQPNAFLCVRLNELLDNGESLQVTYGLLNLTHRNSHEFVEPLEPGKKYQVSIALNDIAHTFKAGSRVRLALSTAFWPLVWPSPVPVNLSVFTAASRLSLPLRKPDAGSGDKFEFAAPRQSRVESKTLLREPESPTVEFRNDLTTGVQTFINSTDTGLVRIDRHGWTFSCKTENRYLIHADDPNSARFESSATETYAREGQLDVRIEARQLMTSDADNFYINADFEAYENGDSVFKREWQETIPRDGV